jgi:transcriptional regulator with XRE-family HTH domain
VGVEFGTFLRQLRQREALTQQELAQRAGVALRTLTYWENCKFQPREHELQLILKALNANPHEQRIALEHLTSRAWKLERNSMPPETEARLGQMPGCGDLVRMLRIRQHLTRERLAQLMCVATSTISRWEQNETIPTDARVQQLCTVLRAMPEEKMALLARKLPHPLFDADKLSQDTWEQHIQEFDAGLWTQSSPLRGLEGLTLTLAAWRLAATRPDGELLLGKFYCIHSAWLLMNGMVDEAAGYGVLGMGLLVGKADPERLWLPALVAICWRMEQQAQRPASLRSVQYLTQMLPHFTAPEMKTHLLLQIAEAASRSGRHELALSYWEAATETAQAIHNNLEHYVQLVGRTQAHLLLAAGRYAEALAALPEMGAHHNSYYRITDRLSRAEALLALGLASEAHFCLAAANKEIDHYGFAVFRPQAAALAQRL